MSKMISFARIKRIRKDNRASIEGLPLQLMIMGIIASLGTAVIVGWISSIQTPTYIGQVDFSPQEILVYDADGNGVFEVKLKDLSLRVLDTGGNPVENANVLIDGSSVNNDHHRLYGKTDADGGVHFHDVSFKLIGDRTTTVTVTISGQGIASDYWTEILVLPS